MCSFLLLARKALCSFFFFILPSSFILLFQGHLLIGNKWPDNNMICVAEEGKIRYAVIWLYGRILFSKEICVCYLTPLLHSAHTQQTLLPIYRESLLAVFSCLTFLFPLGLVTALWKMLSLPFRPLRSKQRSRAWQIHKQLTPPLKNLWRATPVDKKSLELLWELMPSLLQF